MIDAAINHIASQLNQYLRRQFELAEDIVVASNITEQDGSTSAHIDNKLVVFLVNIEKDTNPKRNSRNTATGASRSIVGYPPIYLNLYLIFAGNFSSGNYLESLKFLSHTISFFQRSPIFDHEKTPDLDKRIEKLVLDIENLAIHDLSSLWGVISGKYLPSILYKVRLVAFDADDVQAQVPTMRGSQPSLSN